MRLVLHVESDAGEGITDPLTVQLPATTVMQLGEDGIPPHTLDEIEGAVLVTWAEAIQK